MISSFFTSFKLKNTYRVNTIIYSLRQLPIIKKILPANLYQDKALKIFGNIISILVEIGSFFLGKLIYILLMIFAILGYFKTKDADTFIHIFVCLTICGGFINTIMFNPSKDKYYAIVLMNMDAKKYTLSNYYYSMLKILIGFMPFTIIFGLIAKVPLWICLVMPILVVMTKMCFNNYGLYRFTKKGKVPNENMPTKVIWIFVIIFIALGYGLPLIMITMNELIFSIIFAISLILGIYSTIKIHKFDEYRKVYKQILTETNVYIVEKQTSTAMMKENVEKQIEFDKAVSSDKTGFAYFHDLFVKRHRKILTKSAEKQTIILIIITIGVIIGVKYSASFSKDINEIILMYLPYFVYIMFLLNRGTVVTQAMFMNCDHSMLTYRIYRTPKVILGLFKERLKTLITINLMPAIVIAIGLPLLLWMTGGTDNYLNYGVLFFTIIAMSIFFSVHYLVMYYLLQPYNINTEIKSSTYKVVQTLTYILCYVMIQLKLPTLYFGVCVTLFSIIYVVVALYLAYKKAPKTFKIMM